MKLKAVSLSQEDFRSLRGASQRDSAALAAAAAAIARIETNMSIPPRIAVMGEFNTGKSSLINMLLGCKAAPAGVLIRTTAPCAFRYGEADEGPASRTNGGQEILLARDILRRVELMDTPSAGDVAALGKGAKGGVRRFADVHGVIWCTLATQAWKASEAREWLRLPSILRRHSLLAVTHADSILESSDKEAVLSRLREEADGLFGGVLPLSITEAMQAYDSEGRIEDPLRWRESGAEAFSASLLSIVSELQRLRSEAAARAAERVMESVLSKLGSVALAGKPSPKAERF